jgi:hypothetical protein
MTSERDGRNSNPRLYMVISQKTGGKEGKKQGPTVGFLYTNVLQQLGRPY